MATQHNAAISVAKGLCIILMVVGHSGCPEQLFRFIYLFHMPAFFFISGWLLKEKYLDDKTLFVRRKVKGLWWPYVKWTVVFTLLHNAFYYCQFYKVPYPALEIVSRLPCVLVFRSAEQLLGGYWFLSSLLFTSLAALAALWLCRALASSLCARRQNTAYKPHSVALTPLTALTGGGYRSCSSAPLWRKATCLSPSLPS